MNRNGGSWSEGRDETLVRLWGDGKSATEIAVAVFGDADKRGAVCGKLHRLGLYGEGALRRRRRTRAHARRVRPPVPPPETEELRQVEDDGAGKRLEALGPGDCRYPLGSLLGETTVWCGHTRLTGRPYCGRCCAVAYKPKPPLQEAELKPKAR